MTAKVVARSGSVVLLADGVAGAVVHPDGQALVGDLAVLLGHGQWQAGSEELPPFVSDDVVARVAAERKRLEELMRP